MDMETLDFQKLLHLVIKKFISQLEDYIDVTSVEKSKVFFEVIKRSLTVSQEIRLITANALTCDAASKASSDTIVDDKVKLLLDSQLQQDLMECAVNSENLIWKSITDDDLYESLYMYSISDKNTMASSVVKLRPSMSLGDLQLYYSTNFHFPSSNTTPNLNCALLSSQFDNCKIQLEEDLSKLKSTLQNEYSSSDLKSNEVGSKLSLDHVGDSRSTFSNEYYDPEATHCSFQFTDWLLFVDPNRTSDYQRLSGDSWEGRTNQFVPRHLYTSELNAEEVPFNVANEDSPHYCCIHDLSSTTEDNLKRDILDLLIGIPSDTFLCDNNRKKFQINSHIHMDKLSYQSTSNFVESFVESGNLFQELKVFSTDMFPYGDGLILRGLKFGVKQVLKLYTEYIMAVKVKNKSMQFLRTDVLEAAQYLNILGAVCKIEIENNNPGELPKGLGLLSYLKESLWPYRRKENAVMIGVILKYVYTPYLNYLEKWMDEGVCYDPYGEFQILEDITFLDRKDELYWKYAFTENSEDPMRAVPSEMKLYTTDILQCGKNMRLLKICCPSLFSLEYMSHCPPPALSILFSDSAAKIKEKMCYEYIKKKEENELNYYQRKKLSEDYLLVQNLSYVTQTEIFQLSKIWFNRPKLDSSLHLDCNIKTVHALQRSNSWENVSHIQNISCDPDYYGVGLLFSSYNSNSKYCPYKNKVLQYNVELLSNTGVFAKKMIPEPSLTCDSKSAEAIRHQQRQVSDNVLISLNSNELEKSHTVVPDDILPGTFMNSLASLLTSDWGDTIEDIYSCLQLSSLQSIMTYNFRSVLDMRMHIVKKAVKEYFMNQLDFQDLLISLKNTYLLLDESFSQLLCEKLFPWTWSCHSTQQFANWSALNEMFCSSLTESSCASPSLLSTGTLVFVDLPEIDLLERNEFLRFFQFEFQISWPLNIIVHKDCINQYMNIFSFLLQLDFLTWLLGNTWKTFMLEAKAADIQNSSQFRAVMLTRFDMHQFICVLRNCIRHDLQGPVWDFLLKNLNSEELSIDALEDTHMQYLNKVLARCFLTKESEVLHEMITVMLQIIYKFCSWALDCNWEVNSITEQYETVDFRVLTTMTETYEKYQKAFYDRLLSITVYRKYGVTNDDGLKRFLETILESRRKYV